MNLALRLLDIIEENGEAELLCDEPFKFKDGGYLELNPDAKWKMERYVNTKMPLDLILNGHLNTSRTQKPEF